MAANHVKSCATEINKILKLAAWLVAPVDDKGHVWGQDERRTVPLEISEHLSVAEDLGKVDME